MPFCRLAVLFVLLLGCGVSRAGLRNCTCSVATSSGEGRFLSFSEAYVDSGGEVFDVEFNGCGDAPPLLANVARSFRKQLGMSDRRRSLIEASEAMDQLVLRQTGWPDYVRETSSHSAQTADNMADPDFCRQLTVLSIPSWKLLTVNFPASIMAFKWHPRRALLVARASNGRLYLVGTGSQLSEKRIKEIKTSVDVNRLLSMDWREGDRLEGKMISGETVLLYEPKKGTAE